MLIRLMYILLLFLSTLNLKSQNVTKQNNTLGSELFADAPFRMKKLDNSGSLASLPIYFYIHESECSGCNNELAYIDIKLKNASDTAFNQPILFNNYNQLQFLSLFKHKSIDDATWGSQSVDNGLPTSSSIHTITFTSDTNWGIPPTPIVDITNRYFYFTIVIPPEYLQNFNDIIDVEVTFGLDWETDQYVYLRIFRSDYPFPVLTNWYRGDTHYHTFFTQNLAENGLPVDAVKYYGSATELNWLITTDHSCDFDNYGVSMSDNWSRLGNTVANLNSQDSSMVLIRGMEMSVNNSAGNTVHALIYPNSSAPFSLPYIGDGNGDTQSSSVNINMMLDSLKKYNAMCYAAHPFAEDDKLSVIVNGSVWNLSDTIFPSNGSPHPSMGTVISNDINTGSDIFSYTDSTLFSPYLCGLELWNLRNTISCSSSENNPWNVMYDSGISGFSELSYTDTIMHDYRFNQNLDVYKAILRRGLIQKNQNDLLQYWKFYMEAGSDAHGSFNYSTTDLTGGLIGNVNDNAIGRLSTLVYCPQGMGLNGKNILQALQNGHSVLSSGPIINTVLTNNSNNNVFSGDDIIINLSDLTNWFVNFDVVNTPEFGSVSEILLFGGNENNEVSVSLPVFTGTFQINFNTLIHQLFPDSVQNNKYFYIRAQLTTIKNYGSLSNIYKKNYDTFNCYTNPIWIKINSITKINENNNTKLTVSPNPANDFINLTFYNLLNNICKIQIFSADGKEFICDYKNDDNIIKVDVSELNPGTYFIKVITNNNVYNCKLVKQ